MAGIDARGFQLVLLRRMADFQPDRVEDAMRALGASRTEMREANRRWQAMVRSRRGPTGARRYSAVLGPAETVRDQPIGDLTCRAHRWPLDLWPDLRFEVVALPSGEVVQEWLVRDTDAPAPTLRDVSDLKPWSCVIDDVARAFAPATPLEGTAPSRWRLMFGAPDAEGRDGRFIADFTWGLLQRVTRADHDAAEASHTPC
ncbi:hypothetical protein [Nocardiopsis gilva]|nr:hypothetical protein [Nocardiopsis gilva]